MSLAQKIERPPTDAAPVATRAPIPVDFRDLARRVVPAAAVQAPVAVVAPVRPEPAPAFDKHSSMAFDLLNEVSRALPAAMARCEKLEGELAIAREHARAEIDAANEIAREWQQIASALKLQVEGLERGLKTMKQRAEAAEEIATASRDAADRSQHAAAEAECLASLFQEKVISSFGAGSLLHPILDTFRSSDAS